MVLLLPEDIAEDVIRLIRAGFYTSGGKPTAKEKRIRRWCEDIEKLLKINEDKKATYLNTLAEAQTDMFGGEDGL